MLGELTVRCILIFGILLFLLLQSLIVSRGGAGPYLTAAMAALLCFAKAYYNHETGRGDLNHDMPLFYHTYAYLSSVFQQKYVVICEITEVRGCKKPALLSRF